MAQRLEREANQGSATHGLGYNTAQLGKNWAGGIGLKKDVSMLDASSDDTSLRQLLEFTLNLSDSQPSEGGDLPEIERLVRMAVK
jgi:hypothetical protein